MDEKYYVDQYGLSELVKKCTDRYKEIRDYIDVSIADQGKIFPSSITVTPGEISGKTVPLTITATFDEPITDTNNPYKSGAKGMRYVVDGTVYNIPYNDIVVSGNTMTVTMNYTADDYGIKNITAIADTDKFNKVEGSVEVNIYQPVKLTFTANTDTTVKVYFTKESYDSSTPDDTISLTANQEKTTTYDRESIYTFEFDNLEAITSAKIEGALLNCDSLFYNCSGLTTLDVTKLNTSNVTDMSSMFYGCSKLTTLDLSNFDTSNVTDMSKMFYGCSGLTTLDVSKFDTSKVTTMYAMFYGCSKLTTIGSVDTASGWQYEPNFYNDMFKNCPATPKPSWYK